MIFVSSDQDFKDGILDEETNGGVGICQHNPQDDFREDSRQSSEVSTLVEETEAQEIVSTRRSSKISSKTVGLPPKVRNMRPFKRQLFKLELDYCIKIFFCDVMSILEIIYHKLTN